MPELCNKMDFRNKLNIFISSAMSDEDGFAWKDLRKAIQSRLDECVLFNTFVIENHNSPLPSVQLFKSHVERADAIILLLKGTVRQGTLQEFDIVKKNHKKLFVYFIKDENVELSVSAIKKEISDSDYCTFYDYDPASNGKIEDIIFKHVMESLVDWYRLGVISNNDIQENQEYMLTNVSSYSNSLPKSILSNFDSCYGESFEILNIKGYNKKIKAKSKLHDVGISMLNWLLAGNNFPKDDEIIQIINTMKDLFPNTLWLSKRWDACKCMANNNLQQAIKCESEALTFAEKNNLPSWIITDILIDCRNISNRACPFSGQEYQDKLYKINELVYFPGLDRFCSNLFNDVIDEHQRETIKGRREVRFGNNLEEIITEFENCLFISMLYGSYTHIVLAREALAKVLYHYGNIYNGENFTFIAAKLQILCGDSKKFEKIINHDWEEIGNDLITNADELLRLAMQFSDYSIILTVIKIFIVFFTEKSIKATTRYMISLSEKTEWYMVDSLLNAAISATNIIPSEDVVIILTNLLKQNIIQNYRAVTSTLIRLNISNVNYDILCDLCNEIKNNAENIVRNNGNPQYIAALINQRKDIFGCLKDVPNNGLVDDELIFFDINTGDSCDYSEKWQAVLCSQIEDITHQMQTNSTNGFYCEFATRPFATIKAFIESSHCKFTDIKQVIDEKLIPLCIQILKNNIAISLTDECIECLISIVIKCKKSELSIPQKLINWLNSNENVENELEYTIYPFNGNVSNNIKYRYLMLKTVCMLDVRDELYYNYLNFLDKSETERIAISECLKEYFNINSVSDPVLISLAFLLSNDNSYEVRMNACYCMYSLTSNKNYSNLSYLKLRELSTDVHPNVRIKLLNIYQHNSNAQKDDKYRDIISNLMKDAHYYIRIRATKILSNEPDDE